MKRFRLSILVLFITTIMLVACKAPPLETEIVQPTPVPTQVQRYVQSDSLTVVLHVENLSSSSSSYGSQIELTCKLAYESPLTSTWVLECEK